MDERPGSGRANGFATATQHLVAVAEERPGELIVDLRGCRFFDSTALKVLLATKGRLEQSNRRLALVVSNSNLMRIFQITRFDELFEIYPSLGAAVQRNGRAGRGRSE